MRRLLVTALATAALAAPASARTYEEILKSKVLRVATRNRPGVTTKDAQGNPSGFYHCLASEYATSKGLKLEVLWRPFEFKLYFTKNGVFDDEKVVKGNATYTPDIFNEADLVLEGLARLPWRERLARLIEVSMSRQVVVFNSERMPKPEKLADLKGRETHVKRGTYQQSIVLELQKQVDFKITWIEETKNESEGNDLAPLLENKADFAVYAASYSLKDIVANPKLGFGFPVAEADSTNWMVARENEKLAVSVEEFLATAKKDGSFDRCFKGYFGMDYNQFLRSLSILKGPEGS